MNEQDYRIVFTGHVIDGESIDSVAEQLTGLLGIPAEKARRMLDGKDTPLRQTYPRTKAERVQKKIQSTGALCRIEPVEPAPASTPAEDLVLTDATETAVQQEVNAGETAAEETPASSGLDFGSLSLEAVSDQPASSATEQEAAATTPPAAEIPSLGGLSLESMEASAAPVKDAGTEETVAPDTGGLSLDSAPVVAAETATTETPPETQGVQGAASFAIDESSGLAQEAPDPDPDPEPVPEEAPKELKDEGYNPEAFKTDDNDDESAAVVLPVHSAKPADEEEFVPAPVQTRSYITYIAAAFVVIAVALGVFIMFFNAEPAPETEQVQETPAPAQQTPERLTQETLKKLDSSIVQWMIKFSDTSNPADFNATYFLTDMGLDAGFMNDSWGTQIAYEPLPAGFVLRSAGADKVLNTADDIVHERNLAR